MDGEPQTLDEYLKWVLKERKVSMTALARSAGLSKQAVYTYMMGSRPTLESCRKLAFYLNESWGKIIGLAYRDVDGKQLQSLIEMYLEMDEQTRHTTEDIMQALVRQANRKREKRT